MLKRILIILWSFILSLTFVSCGFSNDESVYRKYKDKVDFVTMENGTHQIEYSGDIYFPFYEKTIFVEQSDDDIFLGWNGSWWGYQNKYYSSQADTPLFIYETRMDCLYIHENYNYQSDTFVVDNTDKSIVWKNIFETQQKKFEIVNSMEVTLYSKQCPQIKSYIELVFYENQWYIYLSYSDEIWTPSVEFVSILSEMKLFEQKT